MNHQLHILIIHQTLRFHKVYKQMFSEAMCTNSSKHSFFKLNITNMKKKMLQHEKSNIRSYAKLPLSLLFRMQKVMLGISKCKKKKKLH